MDSKAAIWFLPDDIALTNDKTPLMLQSVMFCPILTWTCAELNAMGVGRLFVVSDVRVHELLRPHIPWDAVLVDGARHAEELLEHLKGKDGEVVVLNGVVLPVGVFSGGAVYRAGIPAVRRVLKEHGAFAAFPEGAEILKGFLPVGDEEELRAALPMCRQKILQKHLDNGVVILDTNNCYIDPRVTIGSGTVILPGTILRGETKIGARCTIGPNTMLTGCTVGDETEVNASQGTDSRIGSHTNVGPFAYLRPNSTVGDHVKVGDFVEIKNSVIGDGTKISHLTYVGDSDVGERVNFGCGTVTTNYDGFKKYRCTIGDDVFIGCNTNLVAPVALGNGSYTAAGSTITRDVPADALGVARARQENKDGWAARNREAKGKKK
ncbi:MAG: glucosamine-1-phosphate N-acetyltransferase [Ruminococcaceae bacterium]|jgi:bifunctional UDP-N-acetylglucosamine pyrophosphorylase/glucosamine-1-phosphate N-acetyltransferase|nr:glucosamine-1-phosphate N-acetyltransferase [Oscillospiraceae bacterium]